MTPDLRRIKLRHLLAFVEVVRSLSLTKAAIALHVTVPAVSKTLHELQDALGVALFTQLQGGIVLSPEGRAFAKHAESGVQMLLRGVEAATEPAAAQARALAIAASPTVAATFLPEVLAELEQRTPVATLSVATGTSAQLLRMLHQGELELVIGRVTATTGLAGVTFEHLYDDEVVLVARAEHPLLRRTRRKLTDIGSSTLILPPTGTAIREEIDRWFASSGIAQPARRIETPCLSLSKKLLLGSDAIWFSSRRVVADELAIGAMKILFDRMPALATPIGILRRNDVPPEPAASNLIEAARAVATRGFG